MVGEAIGNSKTTKAFITAALGALPGPISGIQPPDLLYLAGKKLFFDNFGTGATPAQDAANQTAWQNYYAAAVEGPAYTQGANIVKELKSAGVVVGTLYADLLDATGNPLVGQPLITAVRKRTDSQALNARSQAVLRGASTANDLYNGDAALKAVVDTFLQQAATKATIKNALLDLARQPALLP